MDWANHKYIRKEMGRNGKWRYIYHEEALTADTKGWEASAIPLAHTVVTGNAAYRLHASDEHGVEVERVRDGSRTHMDPETFNKFMQGARPLDLSPKAPPPQRTLPGPDTLKPKPWVRTKASASAGLAMTAGQLNQGQVDNNVVHRQGAMLEHGKVPVAVPGSAGTALATDREGNPQVSAAPAPTTPPDVTTTPAPAETPAAAPVVDRRAIAANLAAQLRQHGFHKQADDLLAAAETEQDAPAEPPEKKTRQSFKSGARTPGMLRKRMEARKKALMAMANPEVQKDPALFRQAHAAAEKATAQVNEIGKGMDGFRPLGPIDHTTIFADRTKGGLGVAHTKEHAERLQQLMGGKAPAAKKAPVAQKPPVQKPVETVQTQRTRKVLQAPGDKVQLTTVTHDNGQTDVGDAQGNHLFTAPTEQVHAALGENTTGAPAEADKTKLEELAVQAGATPPPAPQPPAEQKPAGIPPVPAKYAQNIAAFNALADLQEQHDAVPGLGKELGWTSEHVKDVQEEIAGILGEGETEAISISPEDSWEINHATYKEPASAPAAKPKAPAKPRTPKAQTVPKAPAETPAVAVPDEVQGMVNAYNKANTPEQREEMMAPLARHLKLSEDDVDEYLSGGGALSAKELWTKHGPKGSGKGPVRRVKAGAEESAAPLGRMTDATRLSAKILKEQDKRAEAEEKAASQAPAVSKKELNALAGLRPTELKNLSKEEKAQHVTRLQAGLAHAVATGDDVNEKLFRKHLDTLGATGHRDVVSSAHDAWQERRRQTDVFPKHEKDWNKEHHQEAAQYMERIANTPGVSAEIKAQAKLAHEHHFQAAHKMQSKWLDTGLPDAKRHAMLNDVQAIKALERQGRNADAFEGPAKAEHEIQRLAELSDDERRSKLTVAEKQARLATYPRAVATLNNDPTRDKSKVKAALEHLQGVKAKLEAELPKVAPAPEAPKPQVVEGTDGPWNVTPEGFATRKRGDGTFELRAQDGKTILSTHATKGEATKALGAAKEQALRTAQGRAVDSAPKPLEAAPATPEGPATPAPAETVTTPQGEKQAAWTAKYPADWTRRIDARRKEAQTVGQYLLAQEEKVPPHAMRELLRDAGQQMGLSPQEMEQWSRDGFDADAGARRALHAAWSREEAQSAREGYGARPHPDPDMQKELSATHEQYGADEGEDVAGAGSVDEAPEDVQHPLRSKFTEWQDEVEGGEDTVHSSDLLENMGMMDAPRSGRAGMLQLRQRVAEALDAHMADWENDSLREGSDIDFNALVEDAASEFQGEDYNYENDEGEELTGKAKLPGKEWRAKLAEQLRAHFAEAAPAAPPAPTATTSTPEKKDPVKDVIGEGEVSRGEGQRQTAYQGGSYDRRAPREDHYIHGEDGVLNTGNQKDAMAARTVVRRALDKVIGKGAGKGVEIEKDDHGYWRLPLPPMTEVEFSALNRTIEDLAKEAGWSNGASFWGVTDHTGRWNNNWEGIPPATQKELLARGHVPVTAAPTATTATPAPAAPTNPEQPAPPAETPSAPRRKKGEPATLADVFANDVEANDDFGIPSRPAPAKAAPAPPQVRRAEGHLAERHAGEPVPKKFTAKLDSAAKVQGAFKDRAESVQRKGEDLVAQLKPGWTHVDERGKHSDKVFGRTAKEVEEALQTVRPLQLPEHWAQSDYEAWRDAGKTANAMHTIEQAYEEGKTQEERARIAREAHAPHTLEPGYEHVPTLEDKMMEVPPYQVSNLVSAYRQLNQYKRSTDPWDVIKEASKEAHNSDIRRIPQDVVAEIVRRAREGEAQVVRPGEVRQSKQDRADYEHRRQAEQQAAEVRRQIEAKEGPHYEQYKKEEQEWQEQQQRRRAAADEIIRRQEEVRKREEEIAAQKQQAPVYVPGESIKQAQARVDAQRKEQEFGGVPPPSEMKLTARGWKAYQGLRSIQELYKVPEDQWPAWAQMQVDSLKADAAHTGEPVRSWEQHVATATSEPIKKAVHWTDMLAQIRARVS